MMISKEELEKQLESTVESLKEDADSIDDDREIAFDVGYISALCYVLGKKEIAEEMQRDYMP
tara:strand:+ start:1642 stop:1827 length:186 start_codon:yes stop_codon:yes gene_type:complete